MWGFFGIHLCPDQGAEPRGTPVLPPPPPKPEDDNDKAGPDKESSGNVCISAEPGADSSHSKQS